MADQNSNSIDRNSKWLDWGLLILRVGIAAFLIINHGWGKFAGAMGYLFGGKEWGFINFIGSIGFPVPTFFALCAAFAEFIGCLLIAVGLLTRYGASFVAFTMGVAVFYHLKTNSEIEFAAIYFLTTLFFVFAGAGKFSVDEWLRNRAPRQSENELVSNRTPEVRLEPEWKK
jgi:putative oxidoreductase